MQGSTHEKSGPPLTADSLTDSAQRFADAALRAYEESNDVMILPMAGVTLEHLAKAVLARHNPAYLLDFRGKFATLLRLTGDPKSRAADVRTIGAAEALQRVAHFVPLARIDDLKKVVDVRNGVLHAGTMPDTSQTVADLVAALQASIVLLEALDTAPERFFLDGWKLVDTLLEERRSTIEREVDRKKSAAVRRLVELDTEGIFEHRFRAIPQLDWGDTGDGYYIKQVQCPVCGQDCQLRGEVIIDFDVDVEVGDEGESMAHAFPVAEWTPTDLNCSYCGLRVIGGEELKVVGLSDADRLTESQYEITQEEIDAANSDESNW